MPKINTSTPKILVIRFSSIGDIVLTTPVLRNLKRAFPEGEIHYFTKPAFSTVLKQNPYITQIHELESPLAPQLQRLKAENFDLILDLHHNLRSLRVKWALGVPRISFYKANLAKFLLVKTGRLPRPIPHIVDRYLDVLRKIGIQPDNAGLDFFLSKEAITQAEVILKESGPAFSGDCLAVVLGATHRTKRWLPVHFTTMLNRFRQPVILLGGPDIRKETNAIIGGLDIPILDAVGKYDLMVSAALMKSCRAVLTHDTGLMHVAAAFGMKIFSIWGSTVPELGMTPWKTESFILENTEIPCRPCTKIGFDVCPKGHFNCMGKLTPEKVLESLENNF
ncbi:MAG: glycosyltransferase family 9 protein [Bacteroidia bacterium]|nr:glycosyltransferase family 9 protein [Bacteroidia bacterium]